MFVSEILKRLTGNEFSKFTYVGKRYTKLDLINDLKSMDSFVDKQKTQDTLIPPIAKKINKKNSLNKMKARLIYEDNANLNKKLKAAMEVIRLCEHAFLTDFSSMKNRDNLEDKANIALFNALKEFNEG